nr:27 kDa primary mesenchyme-specific spicule protein-like [Leptinotarsa decemlineata]
MQLIAIRNRKESELLRHLVADSTVTGPFWTSGEKRGDSWAWSTSREPISFVNWKKNKPSIFETLNECIEIDEIAQWSDQNCEKKRYFVCEVPQLTPSVISSYSEPSGSQCAASSPPIVKVYISNNIITEEGTNTVAEKFLTSEDVQVSSNGGYHVQVKNNIDASPPEKDITRHHSFQIPKYLPPE